MPPLGLSKIATSLEQGLKREAGTTVRGNNGVGDVIGNLLRHKTNLEGAAKEGEKGIGDTLHISPKPKTEEIPVPDLDLTPYPEIDPELYGLIVRSSKTPISNMDLCVMNMYFRCIPGFKTELTKIMEADLLGTNPIKDFRYNFFGTPIIVNSLEKKVIYMVGLII